MRDTHKMKYDALNYEVGFDVSDGEDWSAYTYVSANEESEFGISIWNEDEEDME
jgi:hypothetical protein